MTTGGGGSVVGKFHGFALLWAGNGCVTARLNPCKAETNTAISMNAQIWNVCIVVTECTMDYQISIYM